MYLRISYFISPFKYAAHAITGNGNDANLLKSIRKKNSGNHIKWLLFLAGFSHLEFLCTSATGGSGATREDALNTVSESTGKATSSGQADVVRHGQPAKAANSGRNSESAGVRKGCDQDEARHRPASGAEVVRYKVESQLPVNAGSNNSAVGGFEKKSGAKNQNQIPSSGTSSDKDKKQQMPLHHQVS